MPAQSQENLFAREEEVLERAQAHCTELTPQDGGAGMSFADLVKEYRSLLNQTRKLVKISDKLEGKLNRAKLQIEEVGEVAKQISMSLDFDVVFRRIATYLQESYGCDACLLILVPAEGDTFCVEKQVTNDVCGRLVKDIAARSFPLSEDGGAIAAAILKGHLTVLDHVDPGSLTGAATREDGQGNLGVVLLPIRIRRKAIGAIVLLHHDGCRRLSSDDRASLKQFANHVAVAVKNSKLFENAEQRRLELVERHCDALNRLNQAYLRFVPEEFLSMLDKQAVTDISLGDQVEREMTILFSDIRAYTTLSETLSPQDNFRFLNSYLGFVVPAIRHQGGVIDKYIGDAIMALFLGSPDDAVRAAVSLQHRLGDFNARQAKSGWQPIRVGIGIHTGMAMLGTIGEPKRMDATVISDSVNLASRIERLTEYYGVAILISEHTVTRLDQPERFDVRFIDRVRVRGKNKNVNLYEVLDGLSPEIAVLRRAGKAAFSEALDLYREGKAREARDIFSGLAARDPSDQVLDIYMTRCNNLLTQDRGDCGRGDMAPWTGPGEPYIE